MQDDAPTMAVQCARIHPYLAVGCDVPHDGLRNVMNNGNLDAPARGSPLSGSACHMSLSHDHMVTVKEPLSHCHCVTLSRSHRHCHTVKVTVKVQVTVTVTATRARSLPRSHCHTVTVPHDTPTDLDQP